jgi:hypothetical protein
LARVEAHVLTEPYRDRGLSPFGRVEHHFVDARQVPYRRVVELAAQTFSNGGQAFRVELDLHTHFGPGLGRMGQVPHGTRKYDLGGGHAALLEQTDVLDRTAGGTSPICADEHERCRHEHR